MTTGDLLRRRLAVPTLLALALMALGHLVLGAVVLGASIAVCQVEAVAPARAAAVDRRIHAVAHGLATVVGAVGLTVVWALVVVPAQFVVRLVRGDPLGTVGSWIGHPRSREAGADGLFGLEPRAARPPSRLDRLGRAIPRVVGWVVIVALADLAVGGVWDAVTDRREPNPTEALAPVADPAVLAVRPALADAPWAEDQLGDYQDLTHRYTPFLLTELVDGRYGDLVIEDGRRVPWEPPGLPADAPEVWVFGGLSAFGRAQRDDHTIASELARQADAAGTPVRVVDFTNPAYTSYHQWMLFERQLAGRPRPAAAVFVDGVADVEVQLESLSPDPTHFNLERFDEVVTAPPEGDLVDQYLDDSLIRRAWNNLESLLGVAPAGADGPSVADNAADLGARARFLIDHLAERDGVPVLHVREPAPVGGPARGPYLAVSERLDGTDLDLTHLLDGEDGLFVDWTTVNEEGARRIAAAVAPSLLPLLG